MKQSVAILILAAGASTRFGGCKQLATFANKSLLQRAIDSAAAVSDAVYVVLGARHSLIAPTVSGVTVVINDNWQTGIGSSIACGVCALEKDGFSSVLILLADQFRIRPDHLARLLAVYSNEQIVTARYRGINGVPAIFPKVWFHCLKQLSGGQGAQAILRQSAEAITTLELPEAAWDIDTQDDYRLGQKEVGF